MKCSIIMAVTLMSAAVTAVYANESYQEDYNYNLENNDRAQILTYCQEQAKIAGFATTEEELEYQRICINDLSAPNENGYQSARDY